MLGCFAVEICNDDQEWTLELCDIVGDDFKVAQFVVLSVYPEDFESEGYGLDDDVKSQVVYHMYKNYSDVVFEHVIDCNSALLVLRYGF